MNPLQTELHRLYLARPLAGSGPAGLPEPQERVRAMVMELAGPPSWAVLARVWQGVQAELELPAPGIAVSGTDGMQLWFSLAEPVTAARAQAFLDALRMRFLADVDPARVRLMPAGGGSATHAPPVPAAQETDGNWSAFLAPDLAPVFEDTPWLDIPPSEDGQAALLRALQPMSPARFEAAVRRLQPPAGMAATPVAPAVSSTEDDPRRFLLRVMNDEAVPLAQRIDAARALLGAG